MKKLVLTLFTLCCIGISFSQIKTPQPSPSYTLKQTVGITEITVNYSRPGAKDRTIFGELVPYNKIWRTGANKATAITFKNDVIFGETKVKKGTYSLFTVPGESEWVVMLNKETELWGAGNYNKENEVASFKVDTKKTSNFTESFTIDFNTFTAFGAMMNLTWENTQVSVPVMTLGKEKLAEQFKKELIDGPDAGLFYNGARFYLDNDLDINLALEWITVATEKRPEAFWMLYQQARILDKAGSKKEAIQAAQKVISIASEKEDDYGYIARAEKLIKELKSK